MPRFLPSFGQTERKDGAMRRAEGVQTFAYGHPYVDNWSPERAVKEGYDRSVWVFRCIDAIASNAAQLEIVLRQGDPVRGTIIKTNPLLDLLNRQSNPFEIAENWFYRLFSIYLLSKRGAYVEVQRDGYGQVKNLYLLAPHLTWPIPDPDTFVSGFRVMIPGGGSPVDVPAKDPTTGLPRVLWIRKPHPLDPYSGVTPMESAGLDIDTDYYTKLYARTFLQNDGRPGGILALKGEIEQDDAEELKRRFSGGSNAGRTAVVSADDANWVDTSANPREIQYAESRPLTRDAILAAFGVPESVLGNASGRTFSNADAEKLVFWQETMGGHLRLVAGALNALVTDPDLFTAFDTSTIDVLQKAKQDEEKHLLDLYSKGLITADEFRDATGRDPFDTPQSRALWMPNTMVPAIFQAKDEEALKPEPPPAPIVMAPGQPPGSRAIGAPRPAIPATSQPAALNPAPAKALDFGSLATKDGGYSGPAGIMVALMIPPGVADQLAVPDGEEPANLHCTLAYLGKVTDATVSRETVLQAVAGFAATAPPLEGVVSGLGRFDLTDGPSDDEGHVVYASLDIPDLPEWRQRLIAVLEAHGIQVASDHGYTPHVSLRYCGPDDPNPPMPPKLDLAFDRVTVTWGADRQSFTLKGEETKAVVLRPRGKGPAGPSPADRAALDAEANARRERWTKVTAAVVRQLFRRQAKVVQAKLTGSKARKGTRHWIPDSDNQKLVIGSPIVTKAIKAPDIFDLKRWNTEWTDDLSGPTEDIYDETISDVADEMDLPVDTKTAAAVALIAAAVLLHASTAAKANDSTASDLERILAEAESKGLSMDEISAAVGAQFAAYETSRADTIGEWLAVGALAGSATTAVGLLADQNPDMVPVTKIWNSQQDELVRASHVDADGQEVPIDDPFDVGGEELMYPGDPNGSLEETVNCRCYLLFAQAGQETGTEETAGAESPAERKFNPNHDELGRFASADASGGDARSVAEARVAANTAAEPAVTSTMSSLADAHGGQMVGLNYAVKSPESYTEKVTTKMIEAQALGQPITATEAANSVRDGLRYTMTFDPQHYTASASSVLDSLKAQGYTVDRIKNTWEPATNPYRGINTALSTPEGRPVELQFHTADSFDLKQSNHADYEKARLPSTSPDERASLMARMGEQSSFLTQPPMAATIR